MIRLHPPLVALLLFFLGYLWFAREIPLDLWASAGGFSARSFPYLAGCLGAAAVGIELAYRLLTGSRSSLASGPTLKATPKIGKMIILIALYITGIEWFGFIIASILFLTLGSRLINPTALPNLLPIAILTPLGLWGLLYVLEIHLPSGSLLRMLMESK